MNDLASGKGIVPEDGAGNGNTLRYYKKNFWSEENLKFSQPHDRLVKAARIINRLAQGKECTLLDVGCGPATLMRLLTPNIQYHGIDIAIHDRAPNLIEADLLKSPIMFGDKRFDIILAQGVFEYVGDFQSQKFAEIARILNEDGNFIVSYWNFNHRNRQVYFAHSNIRPFDDFRKDLARYFNIDRFFPTSHNWNHSSPSRRLNKAINMRVNMHIPFISEKLAVEYFFLCSSRDSRGSGGRRGAGPTSKKLALRRFHR
jgi:SAM-dependent methyltransferase